MASFNNNNNNNNNIAARISDNQHNADAHSQNNPNHLLAFDAPTLVIQAFQSGGDTLRQVGAFASELTYYVELFQQQQQQQQRGAAAGTGVAVGHFPTPTHTNDSTLPKTYATSAAASAAPTGGDTVGGFNVTPKQPILPQKRRVSDFKTDQEDERNVASTKTNTKLQDDDDDTETEDDGGDDDDDKKPHKSEKAGRPSGPHWYKGKSLKETHLQHSTGLSRKVLDLYWSELGLTAPFGKNAVISMKGCSKVSHLSLKNTYSVLPYKTTYPLKYTVGANTPGRKNAVFLQKKKNPTVTRRLPLASATKKPSEAPTVPVFWSPWATKDGTKYHYIGHYRCVTERGRGNADGDDSSTTSSSNTCLEFQFEHYDDVLDAKLAHINPDYVKKEPTPLLSQDY